MSPRRKPGSGGPGAELGRWMPACASVTPRRGNAARRASVRRGLVPDVAVELPAVLAALPDHDVLSGNRSELPVLPGRFEREAAHIDGERAARLHLGRLHLDVGKASVHGALPEFLDRRAATLHLGA